MPERMVGELRYELTRKRVKNLNLRIRTDGTIAVSAPQRTPLAEIDRFVASRAQWIDRARRRVLDRMQEAADSQHSDAECLAVFEQVSDRIYPLFARVLPCKPELRVRQMKSRWGSCCPAKNRITLNKQLLDKPYKALEYVVLHEYVHFLHPDHQAAFHAEMARLMPDYKVRRALLK